MTVENAIKKLEKVTGQKVQKDGVFYSVVKNGERIQFIAGWSGNAQCISVCREHLQSDPMTDYFPQTYCDNISQAIRLAGF